MTYGLLPTGFVKPTLEEILNETKEDLRAEIDPTLDLSPDQPFGQATAIGAQREAMIWEVLETLANALNPNAAENTLLDNVCAFTGTEREQDRKSRVFLNCTVGADFVAAPGAMMANVSGQDSIRFVNRYEVDRTGQGAGVASIEFIATEYGPVVANAGTVTVITAPVSGWTVCTNPADAIVGAFKEKDASLRARREDEVTAAGGSGVDQIRVDVAKIDGVRQCFVFENVTLETDSNGLPGKSFEVVIYDGVGEDADDQTIAETIWKSKGSGAQSFGTTGPFIVTAEDGQEHPIYFSRATIKPVWLIFDVVYDPKTFPSTGVQLIKDAVAAKGRRIQNLGIDVISLKMKSAAEEVTGVLDVTNLRLGFTAFPNFTANLPVSTREIASIDTSRITVNVSTGTP